MTLLLCIALMFSFVACKQTNANDEDVASKQLFVSQIEITDDNSQQTTSGIELEEDVFDDALLNPSSKEENQSSNASQGNSSQSTSSSTTVSKENPTENTTDQLVISSNPSIEILKKRGIIRNIPKLVA